jgi:hypothetical protein
VVNALVFFYLLKLVMERGKLLRSSEPDQAPDEP